MGCRRIRVVEVSYLEYQHISYQKTGMPSHYRRLRGGWLCRGIVVGTAVTDGSGSLYDMRPRASAAFSVAAYIYLVSMPLVERFRDRDGVSFADPGGKGPARDPHSDYHSELRSRDSGTSMFSTLRQPERGIELAEVANLRQDRGSHQLGNLLISQANLPS